jgi:hypothetical protein
MPSAPAYTRYHIPTVPAADRADHPARFVVRVKRLGLLRLLLRELVHYRGNLPVVLSRPCVYGVFSGPVGGFLPRPRQCVGCLRCTVQYPDMVRVSPNPRRLSLGDSFFGPDVVDAALYEAATGRVPVRGAGFRGAFSGPGWDGMWTDMSEIVRPTRDGIHGREFISTAVDVGRKPRFLVLQGGAVLPADEPELTLPIPFAFDVMPKSVESLGLYRTMADAAQRLETLALVPWEWAQRMAPNPAIVPVVTPRQALEFRPAKPPRMVELDGWEPRAYDSLRATGSVVAVRLPLGESLVPLVDRGVGVIHGIADYHGHTEGGFILEALRAAHDELVRAGMREEVTLLSSGGIAAAEHVPKAIIAGADAVVLDIPLLLALQARLQAECRSRATAAIDLPATPPSWRTQRLLNLAGSWRDQLLEVLGAMGLREVRRLRGEIGRAMFAAELEREAFAGIAGFPG